MANMPVKDANGAIVYIQTTGTGTITDPYINNPAVSIVDGANATQGFVADTIATAGGTGTMSAKLRRATQGLEDLKTLIVLAAGSNLIGKIGIDQTTPGTTNAVVTTPTTTGGLASYNYLSTSAVLSANIKNSAGQVYSLQFFNIASTPRYIRLYNQTTAPASTDTANIVWKGMVPGNSAGAVLDVTFPGGLAFSTGIGIRVTAAIADNDTTAPTGNDVMGDVGYK